MPEENKNEISTMSVNLYVIKICSKCRLDFYGLDNVEMKQRRNVEMKQRRNVVFEAV